MLDLGDLTQISQLIRELQGDLVASQSKAPNEQFRQLMVEVHRELGEKHQQLIAEFTKTKADLESRVTQAQQKGAALKAKQAELEAELKKAEAEAAKAPAPPKKPEPKKVDPKLGAQLRDDLLERFGGQSDDKAPLAPLDPPEIWEDWDWQAWENN